MKKKETANGKASRDLDAALGAAFRSETAMGELLTQLHSEHGIRSGILRRDAEDRNAPLLGQPGDSFPERSGRYRILGELARGGMGRIYKGRDEDLGREVAIKVLRKDLAQRPAMIQRFVEEAQIGGQLQHPGILPVFELGRADDQQIFFSMKLIQGQTLAELLEERSGLHDDRMRFLGIFEQVCQTISYAHAREVIHRDLKPSNIMVGAFGEVQVVDWGLAKVLPRGGSVEARHAAARRSRGRPDAPWNLPIRCRTDRYRLSLLGCRTGSASPPCRTAVVCYVACPLAEKSRSRCTFRDTGDLHDNS